MAERVKGVKIYGGYTLKKVNCKPISSGLPAPPQWLYLAQNAILFQFLLK